MIAEKTTKGPMPETLLTLPSPTKTKISKTTIPTIPTPSPERALKKRRENFTSRGGRGDIVWKLEVGYWKLEEIFNLLIFQLFKLL
jgi:hypothetical protein